ncbi:MAG: sigma-70 family RNA polymerase sigma factor [Oscillospiraceae bacterium]|nr:sigma-70 family RNA polymerase sigma factor [Oscillospiraceae bacterium]
MQSMEEIYQAHCQTVYRYLLSLTRDEHLAEELTQETFYQAVKSVHRFDGSCKMTTWLCSIAKHQLQAYHRKHPPREELTERDLIASSPEGDVLSAAGRVQLLQKLHNLEEPGREVMYLRLFGDLSFREIGQVLNKTENWARVTYYRAKERLRKELERHE